MAHRIPDMHFKDNIVDIRCGTGEDQAIKVESENQANEGS